MKKIINIITLLFITTVVNQVNACSSTNFMVDWGTIGEIRHLSDAQAGGPGRPYVVFTISSKPGDWFGFLITDDLSKQRLAILLSAKANGTNISFFVGPAPAWPFSLLGSSTYAHQIAEIRVQ